MAREIRELGHPALALVCDVRDPAAVAKLVDGTVGRLGRLDVLIYNSGAIWWSSVFNTPFSRFRLMQQINPEGLYAAVTAALPHFRRQSWRGRIVVVSPPIYSRFFRGKTAYAMGKVGMSVLTKGLAMDFDRLRTEEGVKDADVAITSIWPAASIESAATESAVAADQEIRRDLRRPTIFSDAILAMLRSPAHQVNGLLDLDEDFLRRVCGYRDHDFDKYNVVPGAGPPRRIMPAKFPSLEVDEQADEGRRVDSVRIRQVRENKGKL